MLNCADWSNETFRHCDFGDKRLTKRLISMSTDLASNIGSTISSSCDGDNTKITAGYRFLRNESATAAKIMEGAILSTAEKVAQSNSDYFLAIEDTTSLSYKHSAREELGCISNSMSNKSKGFLVHTALLVDEKTNLLGIIHQNRWIRRDDEYGKRETRSQRPYEEKESFKWEACSKKVSERLSTEISRVISVCDREADIFPYLDYKQRHKQRFIVRAAQDRLLCDEHGRHISDAVMETEELGKYQVHIEQRGGRSERFAEVAVRSLTVEIKAPKSQVDVNSDSLAVNIVVATEIGSVAGQQRLNWILLTSERSDSYDSALNVIKNYEKRWLIEEFHKCWKSGLGVEELRMQSASNLEAMAVILAPIAVRVMQLRDVLADNSSQARHCDEVLSHDEFVVLWKSIEKKKRLPKKKPDLLWIYKSIAKLGGWSDSKRTGKASWATIWKGWARLAERVEGYLLMVSQ